MKLVKRFILVLPFLIIASSLKAENTHPKPFRIGAILPLSGESASLGRAVRQGIDLALSELNQEQADRIKLIYEDDQLVSSKSVSAFNKLLNVDQVDAVLVLGSGVGNAIAPLAEQHQVIMVAIAASDKSLVIGKKYAFIHWVSPESEAKVMVEEIRERKFKRIALLTNEQEGALALENALTEELAANGLKDLIQLSSRELVDTRDFKTFIAKAKSQQIDGVCVALLPGGLAAFAKQSRDLKLSADLFGFELFEDLNEVKASDGALIGKWYVNADDASDVFRNNYYQRYKEEPGFAAANAYDTVKLLIEGAIRESNDKQKIAEYLRQLKDYSGAIGTYSATGDNRFDLPVAVKRVTENGFVKNGA